MSEFVFVHYNGDDAADVLATVMVRMFNGVEMSPEGDTHEIESEKEISERIVGFTRNPEPEPELEEEDEDE